MTYTVILMLHFNPAWLALDRAERNRFNAMHIHPILARYRDRVDVRFFDAEAFSAEVSDFAILSCQDLKDHYFFMEELRDTPLFSQGLATLKGVLMGLEEGHQAFERMSAPPQAET